MSNDKDPFRLAAAAEQIEREQQQQQSGPLNGKYEAGEHQWLGMRGASLACEQLDIDPESLRRLQRKAGDVELSYGEIVALSGDFYGKPEGLFEEEPGLVPSLHEKNDLSDLRERFASELTWIIDEHRPRDAGYPDNTVAFLWNAKSYMELAEDNTKHFGWHNVLWYCECHQMAIDEAIKARSRNPGDENWMRALFYNGFADHFLTDGFAAGHIRVPRQEIRDWAPNRGYSGKLAGLLSKVLHDQDGHVSTLHAQGEVISEDEGLPVRNSLGIEWSTRCDGQLFLVHSKESAPLIAEPVMAVAASLLEVFRAQEEKRRPAGQFQALNHVPFPRPGSQSLADKFKDTPPDRIERLLKSFKWYTRLPLVEASLDKDNIETLFRSLPELMANFRSNVARDVETKAALSRHMPAQYIEAFRRIG